ncbi:MAG TPA: hypothetical protein VGF98_14345 [Candidatus Tumulicola sp.]|jgi:hypothetical protein
MDNDQNDHNWTDVTQPFLVLACAPISPKCPKALITTVFLVNPTELDIENIEVETGGHFSDPDMGVVEATGTVKRFARLNAHGAVIIEQADPDELYEFVCTWDVKYEGAAELLRFSLTHGRDGVAIADVPVLGGRGDLIQRWFAK